jgi:hypothetical protein
MGWIVSQAFGLFFLIFSKIIIKKMDKVKGHIPYINNKNQNYVEVIMEAICVS